MTLATRCPHCSTLFRVAHDQLKLRGGLVRCGRCKQIFNGSAHLCAQRPEPESWPDNKHNKPDGSDLEGLMQPPLPPADADPIRRPVLTDPMEPVEKQMLSTAGTPTNFWDGAGSEEAQLLKMPSAEPEPAAAVGPTAQAEREMRPQEEEPPVVNRDAGHDEPSFMRKARRQRRLGVILRVSMASGCVLLFITLLAQSVYLLRDQLAARYPAAQPLLVELCARLGCRLGLPAQIEMLSIESSDLEALAPERYALTAILRNRGLVVQDWPHIELTLNDLQAQPVARRVVSPEEYLPHKQQAAAGVAGRSEQSLKLLFEVSQLKPYGYRVYLFYP